MADTCSSPSASPPLLSMSRHIYPQRINCARARAPSPLLCPFSTLSLTWIVLPWCLRRNGAAPVAFHMGPTIPRQCRPGPTPARLGRRLPPRRRAHELQQTVGSLPPPEAATIMCSTPGKACPVAEFHTPRLEVARSRSHASCGSGHRRAPEVPRGSCGLFLQLPAWCCAGRFDTDRCYERSFAHLRAFWPRSPGGHIP